MPLFRSLKFRILSLSSFLLLIAVLLSTWLGITSFSRAGASRPAPTKTSPSIAWKSPITITKGGTYAGNWQSLDPNVPAVTVFTTEPVIIQNCHISSRGHLIATKQDNAHLTVRACSGSALNPNNTKKAPGRFVYTQAVGYLDIEHNYLEGTSGIEVSGYGGKNDGKDTIKVLYNSAKNIDGRYSNGKGGFSTAQKVGEGWDYAQFVQLSDIHGVSGIEIAWNQVINELGNSKVEDNISVYLSSGTAKSPILIHDNYIRGAYGMNAQQDKEDFSGGGIMLGDDLDADPPVTIQTASGFVKAYNNQVISSANYGIAIESGHDSSFYNNRVVSSGYLANGTYIAKNSLGIMVWDENGEIAKKIFFNNFARDNIIGVAKKNQRNDTWFPDCSKGTNGSSLCVNNKSLPNPITQSTEQGEYSLWQQKLTQAHISLPS